MITGNVTKDLGDDGRHHELWHFKMSDDLTLHFHKYELIHHCAFNLADVKTVSLWQYPDLTNKSTIQQPEIPTWAIQDAKSLILSKIKIS